MKKSLKTPKTDWERVNALSDEDIDYSDIPEATEEMFKLMTKQDPEKDLANVSIWHSMVKSSVKLWFIIGGLKKCQKSKRVIHVAFSKKINLGEIGCCNI